MCKADLNCVICNKNNSHIPEKTRCFNVWFWKKNELGFFRIPDFDFNVETADPSPTGLVKVTRGKLPAEIVQAELGELIRI